MKKKTAILLCATLCFSSIAGCGSTATDPAGTQIGANEIASENAGETDSDSTDGSEDEKAPTGDMSLVNAGSNVKNHDPYVPEVHDGIAKETDTIEATHFELPSVAEESDIYVEPIAGISDNFIRGVDASEVLSIENSGAVYYDENGNEQDVFITMAQNGVNYIRLRIWNDPYDKDGNGYGGGNCDIATAVALGKRATAAGMNVLIDYHYSDFWADPDRQTNPKAWKSYKIEEKQAALYDFTYDSLEELICAGVNVTMVQVGNETNNGMSGETNTDKVMSLMSSGSKAVRDISSLYGKEIKVALHYTNSTDYERIDNICSELKSHNIDYDIMGLSYYAYWSGTFDQFRAVMENIRNTYGKEVMIAEFSYPYTSEDGDCFANSAAGGEMLSGYTSSVQSQASMIRDMCALAQDSGALGVFYWGGCWIPVGDDYDTNLTLWETCGSGWASRFADEYDSDHVGGVTGGSSWDNQALFDFNGRPLPSLSVFKYLKTGTVTEDGIDYVQDQKIQVLVGKPLNLPEKIPAIHKNRNLNADVAVTWDKEDIAQIDTDTDGEYIVKGTVKDGDLTAEVTATVTVGYINILPNASFEDEDLGMWEVSYEGENPTDFQNNAADAHTGDFSFHFWSPKSMDFTIEQTLNGIEPGTYMASVFSQGGDMDDSCELTLYVKTGSEEYTVSFMDAGWTNWQNPSIYDIPVTDGSVTVGVHMKCNALSWGTLDDFSLCRTD